MFETYIDYVPHFFEDGMPLSLMLGGFFMCNKGKDEWFIRCKSTANPANA